MTHKTLFSLYSPMMGLSTEVVPFEGFDQFRLILGDSRLKIPGRIAFPIVNYLVNICPQQAV
jgi:hypothetical protein